MKSRIAQGGGAVSFNMTPMIDIVFNLIIFFMLVSQFHQMETVPVELPPAAMADPKRDEIAKYSQIVVNVVPKSDKVREVIIGGRVLVVDSPDMFEKSDDPWAPLIKELERRKKAASEGIEKPVNVILRSGAEVPYETIGSIMLATSKAGIPYWWVQAYRPGSGAEDSQEWEYLGKQQPQTAIQEGD